MLRSDFWRLLDGRPGLPVPRGKHPQAGDVDHLRAVRLRVQFLQDQVDRVYPARLAHLLRRIETLERRSLRLVAFPRALDDLGEANERLGLTFDEHDSLTDELESGCLILSYAADANVAGAQLDVRRDDLDLARARLSFERTLRAWAESSRAAR